MSWRDPNWKYQPAATHDNDSRAFRKRMAERARRIKEESARTSSPPIHLVQKKQSA